MKSQSQSMACSMFPESGGQVEHAAGDLVEDGPDGSRAEAADVGGVGQGGVGEVRVGAAYELGGEVGGCLGGQRAQGEVVVVDHAPGDVAGGYAVAEHLQGLVGGSEGSLELAGGYGLLHEGVDEVALPVAYGQGGLGGAVYAEVAGEEVAAALHLVGDADVEAEGMVELEAPDAAHQGEGLPGGLGILESGPGVAQAHVGPVGVAVHELAQKLMRGGRGVGKTRHNRIHHGGGKGERRTLDGLLFHATKLIKNPGIRKSCAIQDNAKVGNILSRLYTSLSAPPL